MAKPILRNRSSRIFIEILISMAIFSSVIFMLNYAPSAVSAHVGSPFGPKCGSAVIDGNVDASEWSTASKMTFEMVHPNSPVPFTATLYVMNSNNYLYMGITINDDELSTTAQYLPKGDGFRIDFDNDHGGTLLSLNDDVLGIAAGLPQFDDSYIYNLPSSSHSDLQGGGKTDGAGAATRVGDLNHFELKHPLCSGDSLDFCLTPTTSNTVGFRLEYLDAEANGSFGSSQYYPGTGNTSEADIVVGNCTLADMFIFLPFIGK